MTSPNELQTDAPPPLFEPRKGLYLVSRTSESLERNQPCEGAFRVRVRTSEHMSVYGGPMQPELGWAIEVHDLQAFVDQVDEPVIVDKGTDGNYTLEIYDGYRE